MKRVFSAALLSAVLLLLCACSQAPAGNAASPEKAGSMELQYAEHFNVDYYADGSAVLTLGGRDRFLLLPEGTEPWTELPVIRIPVSQVYVASSSVPDLFLCCGALGSLRFTGTNRESWRLPELQSALEAGTLLYAGKYSMPDYELLLEEGCDLVIENTMILHNPETREKLESLGFPVMVEYSSYESHPLGRVEWIRLYGLLTGHAAEAEAFFEAQSALLQTLVTQEPTEKSIAFFHITSSGSAVVRKSADYVTRMIELAGGHSCFAELPESENALSTTTIQMESFYQQAKDADVLIYNSTVSGDLSGLTDLLEKSSLLADFKAVQNGDVWCTEQSMFQQSSATAGMIRDFRSILTGEAAGLDRLQYLHRLT